ncbi:MAG: ABC transporter permease [Propionibacteriaceae bacterium]
MTQPGLALAIALVALLVLALVASWWGRLRLERSLATAALRAVVQLALVSLIITAVLGHLLGALGFVVLMFGVAVATSARRIEAARCWPWVTLALAGGIVPVLVIIFVSGAVAFNGPSIVPMAGIIIGGTMTGHSLAGRKAFAALRDERGAYEAALSLGLPRPEAVSEVITRHLPEALVPALDQTRTVGLVTLPGAFVGVLLGGGTPLAAGAAQVLVLVGLLASQAIAVTLAHHLVRAGRLLPCDLRESLPS